MTHTSKVPLRYIVYNSKGVFQASYSTDNPFGAKEAYKYAKMCVSYTGGEIKASFPHDPDTEVHVFKQKSKRPLKK